MPEKEGTFMVAVGAVIENSKSGKLLIIKRNPKADFSGGTWEIVTGRMKQSENPKEAVKREVKEETNLGVKIVKPIDVFHILRNGREAIGIVYWCKTNTEKVKISSEHVDYKWLAPDDALRFVKHLAIKRNIRAFIKERSKE